AAGAADALHPHLQRVEAELDVLVEQLPRRHGLDVHAEERLERQRLEVGDAARPQLVLGEALGESQARKLRADPVDLPSDPTLLAKERDALDVFCHVAARNSQRSTRNYNRLTCPRSIWSSSSATWLPWSAPARGSVASRRRRRSTSWLGSTCRGGP